MQKKYCFILVCCIVGVGLLFIQRAPGAVYVDAIGDAQTGGIGKGSVPIDLTQVVVELRGDDVHVNLAFDSAQPISAPSSGLPNALSGGIDFDIDRNRATGTVGFVDAFRLVLGEAPSGLGVDAAVNFSSENLDPGLVQVLQGTTLRASVPIQISPTAIDFSFPISILQGITIGPSIDFAVDVGSDDGVTDTAPNPFGSFTVPEPTAVSTSILTLGGMFCRRRRRLHRLST